MDERATPEERLQFRSFQEALDFHESLAAETDRGCALIATGYLDNKLLALRCAHVSDESTAKVLLSDSKGGLGTFSGKLKPATLSVRSVGSRGESFTCSVEYGTSLATALSHLHSQPQK